MSGPAWTPKEAGRFLALTYRLRAEQLAAQLSRSLPAIQGMRRKLKRLLVLGASNDELDLLLAVNERIVLSRGLQEIRGRAQQPLVPVQHYLRRGRATGRPHLVGEHLRFPVEKAEAP